MAEFSFKRDFRSVIWGQTLVLNFFRSFAAGIVWFIVSIFVKPANPALLLFPLVYFLILMPTGIISGKLSEKGVPFAGLFTKFISLLVAVGDPLVYVLHKIKPGSVPVEKFSFFNFYVIIFVLGNKELEKLSD